MGLGKTVQALAIADFHRRAPAAAAAATAAAPPRPVLVLCPPTLRPAWRAAVRRWLPAVPARAVHAPRDAHALRRVLAARAAPPRDKWDHVPDVHFVVAAYDTLRALLPPEDRPGAPGAPRPAPPTPDAIRFPIVLADECHVLCNVHAARTRAAMPFLLAAETCVLISGTPLRSRAPQLFPLLRALYEVPGRPFLSYPQFLDRYGPADGNFGNKVARVEELNALLANVMVRRVKTEVRRDLPPKVRRHVQLQISEETVRPLRGMVDEMDALKGHMARLQGDRLVEMRARYNAVCQALFRATAMVKVPGVVARVQQLLLGEGGARRKVLVFAHHLAVLDAVAAWANREQVPHVRLDGRTNAAKRGDRVDVFQNDPEVRLAVLSLAVAGTGLTLTAADVVLFAELSWVPSVLVQAEDRAHRIGRVGSVTIEYVVAEGTGDDLMWAAVRAKLAIINKAVDGSERKRKEAFDVSVQSGKRICLSELDSSVVLADAICAMEAGAKRPDADDL